MPILKTLNTPNGATVGFHRVMRTSVSFADNLAYTDVASWVSEAACLSGAGLIWMWSVSTPIASVATIESTITGVAPFDGGTVIADGADTLSTKKLRKWEQIKQARAALIDAPLTTPSGIFDSYAEARGNITDAVLLAQTLNGIGQPVAIAYTLADNTVVTLDLAKMINVGLMLGSKVQTVRGIATGLRTQIEAATTTTQLDAITWPT